MNSWPSMLSRSDIGFSYVVSVTTQARKDEVRSKSSLNVLLTVNKAWEMI